MSGGNKVVALAGLLASAGLSGCLGWGQDRSSEDIQEAGPISRVEIDVDAGAVMIDARGTGEGAEGSVESRWTDRAPEIVHYVEDGVLHVIGRCASGVVACLVDVNLKVPPSVNVGVSSGRGNVEVNGVHGDVEAMTGLGDIVLQDDAGSLVAETKSGDISGAAIGSSLVDIRTTDGDIDMELLARPMRASMRTENGDIAVIVPAGSYRIEADSANGDTSVSDMIKEDLNADSVLVLETRSGSIDVGGGPSQERGQTRARHETRAGRGR